MIMEFYTSMANIILQLLLVVKRFEVARPVEHEDDFVGNNAM
jgi:hypothetical protein